MEKNRESLIVRTRCPQCSTPYTVDAYLINSSLPVFQCRGCNTRFTFNWPQNFLDVEITASIYSANNTISQTQDQSSNDLQASEIEQEIVKSPAVDEPLSAEKRAAATIDMAKELIEIPTGTEPVEPVPVVEEPKGEIEQPKDLKDISLDIQEPNENKSETSEAFGLPEVEIKPAAQDELQALWRLVVEDWANRELHDKFLGKCLKTEELTFAAHKYAKVLKLNPVDEFALPMKKKINAMVEAGMAMKAVDYTEESKRAKFKVNDYGLSWLGLGISLVVIAFGLIQPEFKNLVGLGAAMIALIFGIRWMFRSNEELKTPIAKLRQK